MWVPSTTPTTFGIQCSFRNHLAIFFRCIASGHFRNSSFKERTAVITQLTFNVTLPLEILAPQAMQPADAPLPLVPRCSNATNAWIQTSCCQFLELLQNFPMGAYLLHNLRKTVSMHSNYLLKAPN